MRRISGRAGLRVAVIVLLCSLLLHEVRLGPHSTANAARRLLGDGPSHLPSSVAKGKGHAVLIGSISSVAAPSRPPISSPMTGARIGEADHPGPEGEVAPPPPQPPPRPLPWELWAVPIPYIDDEGKLNFELTEPGMEDIVRNELRGVAMEDVDFEMLMQECKMAAGWRATTDEREARLRAEQWAEQEAHLARSGTRPPSSRSYSATMPGSSVRRTSPTALRQ